MSSSARRLLALLEKEDVRSISRRYFVSNGFDGTLTSIGVIVGAAVGLCTSAPWSVREIERAEKLADIARLECAMLVDLDDTRIQRESAGERGLAGLTGNRADWGCPASCSS